MTHLEPFKLVLSKLKRTKVRGTRATALCPAHADTRPSLSIKQDKTGSVLVHCHAGCKSSLVLDALGLREVDLNPNLEATYVYTSPSGEVVFEKLRMKDKSFLCRVPKSDGSYSYSLKGVPPVLYNLSLFERYRSGAEAEGETPVAWLVEGEKDADRLVESGFLATTAPFGAKSSWSSKYARALKGFQVFILPDNDEAGRHYAQAAAKTLAAAGVAARIVTLPELPEHGDVSDWLNSGHSIEELQQLAIAAPHSASQAQDNVVSEVESVFRAEADGIYALVRGRDEDRWVRLTNFVAFIHEDVLLDDGAEPVRKYRIGSPSSANRIEVLAPEFVTLAWVSAVGGARFIISSAPGLRAKVCEAIQVISLAQLKERIVYTHLGWRSIDGVWYFLHGGGAVSEAGAVDHVEVHTEGRLRDCILPPVTDLRVAVLASLHLLAVAPHRVSYPLLAAVYRAPLSECVATTMALYIAGDTGSRKSAITGVAQAHFGICFAYGKTFIANWSSTANSIERMSFLSKDILCTVDDFVFTGGPQDMQRLVKTAEQVIRGQGNRAGRMRMRADATLRPEMHSRGLILASGEAIPPGKSLGARMIVVDVGTSDVNNDVLTTLQRDADGGRLAEAMAGYVQWLAPQIGNLKKTLRVRQDELRGKIGATHARTSENVAQLFLGLEVFLEFAATTGAISEDERENHLSRAREVFADLVTAQDRHINSEDPVEHFFALLKAILSSGVRGHLGTLKGGRPEPATAFGWQGLERTRHEQGGETIHYVEWRPGGGLLGWIEGDNLYLDSHATYAAVQRLAGDNNLPMPIPVQQLGKRLKERGLLVSTRARNENKAQITVNDRVVTTAFHLSATRTLGVLAEDSTDDDVARSTRHPEADEEDENIPF